MSISDKLIGIVKNIPIVYNTGIFNLANSDNKNFIKKVQTTKSITITDITPVRHYVKIKLNPMQVEVLYGYEHSVSNDYVTVTWDSLKINVTMKFSPDLSSYQTLEPVILCSRRLKAGSYSFTMMGSNTKIYLEIVNLDGTSIKKYSSSTTFTLDEDCDCYLKRDIFPQSDSGATSTFMVPYLYRNKDLVENIALIVTDENNNHKEYFSDSDGNVNGVMSTYPSMNFSTEWNNALMEIEYIKDVAKVTEQISTTSRNDGYSEGYDKGYNEGLSVSYDEGVKDGKKSEYDTFWDSFQKNGERRAYRNSFGNGWTDETFKPKYPFGDISDGYMMFAASGIKDIPNLKIVGSSQYCFFNNKTIEHLKEIAVNDDMYGTFSGCSSLVTIDKLIINYANTSGKTYTSSFSGCSVLKNIVIEGEIKGNISFQYSPKLSKDSIISIVNALSSTATGKTLTLSKTAVDEAFKITETETDDSGNSTSVTVMGSSSEEWSTLIATKTNWTISLV